MTKFDITLMTTEERLDLIGEIWDSLAPEDVRLTPAQDAELSRRMATFDADCKSAVSFEDIETSSMSRSPGWSRILIDARPGPFNRFGKGLPFSKVRRLSENAAPTKRRTQESSHEQALC